MSGYPPTSQGYGYGYGGGNQPPPPQPPYSSSTGNNPPTNQGYGYGGGNNPPYGSSSPYAVPYGASKPQSSSAPSAPPYAPSPPPGDFNPPKEKPFGGGYGASPPSAPYGSAAAPRPGGYGAAPPHSEYGGYGAAPRPYGGYGAAAPPSGVPEYGGYGGAPPRPGGGGYGGYPSPQGSSYGSPFASLVPSGFAPGTDPNIVACFQAADQDGSGFIDDKELQGALSSYQQRFSMRTVHLLMYLFTNSNAMKIGEFSLYMLGATEHRSFLDSDKDCWFVKLLLSLVMTCAIYMLAGPKEFTALFYSLQNWRVSLIVLCFSMIARLVEADTHVIWFSLSLRGLIRIGAEG